MRFLHLIMGLVLAHGCLWSVHQTRAVSLDFAERGAKTTTSRIDFNSRAIFPISRGRPLSSTSVREDLISDKSTLQPVTAVLALAMTEEKAETMLAVRSSDLSYATDFLCACRKADLLREPALHHANVGSAGAGGRSVKSSDNAVSVSSVVWWLCQRPPCQQRHYKCAAPYTLT
jgi:hypothetical protein